MTCTKLKKMLNEAIVKGETSLKIIANSVTVNELEDIKECGYNVIKEGKYIIVKQ